MQRFGGAVIMIKNILVPLTGFDSDAAALQTAYLLGAPFAANLACLRVQPDPMRIVARAAVGQFGSSMGNVELIHALQKEGDERTAKAQRAFEDFAKRNPSAAATLKEIEGDPIADTTREARYADLVVVGRAPKVSELTALDIGSVLVGCGRPVLLAPEKPASAIGATIAVAWKETAEAARAVTAAMPLLQRAKRVAVLTAEESVPAASDEGLPAERLARKLAAHGISAEARHVAPGKRPASEALLAAAHEAGADLLVMGAYSHSRFREFVFGGFTRQILQACDLPVLMLH
jgi:nucleotide-binding universal stress UspA family protein